MKDIDDEVLFKLVKYHLNKIYHKRKDKIIHAGTGLTQPAQWYRDFAQAVIDVALKDLVMDVRCEGCGYMTHHREHMGCVRAAKQHTHPAPNVPATSEPVLTVEREPDYWSGGHFYEGNRSYINPTKVWSLPIGTELYTRPAPSVPDDVVRDAIAAVREQYRGTDWGKAAECICEAIDAAIAAAHKQYAQPQADALDAEPMWLQVDAEVRYWEDATVNGDEDTEGDLIPLKQGNRWVPVIRLADGFIAGWPQGVSADIHYKVCDQGEYFLINAALQRVSKYRSYYVTDMLSVGDDGYGDYIILKVNGDGFIEGWTRPVIDEEMWEPIDRAAIAAAKENK